MPNVGDELHHFGWNACSSALCPWAPHPHVERRYLLVPGLRSSRIHVVDVKDDPAEPEARQGHRGRGARQAHRLQPPAHRALRPRRPLHVRARQPRRRRPRRRPPARPRRLLAARPVGDRPRPAEPRLRRLVEHRLRHAAHERVGHAEHGRGRAEPRAARPVRPPPPRLGPQEAPPQAGDRPRRRAADGARAAPRARPDQAVRVRRRRRLDRRPHRLGVAVGAQARRVGRRHEGHRDPAGAGRDRAAPARAAAVRRRPAAHHRHRAERRRPDAARLLLGHRRAQALRRHRPAQPEGDRLGAPRRDRPPRRPPGGRRSSTAARRWSR